MYVLARITSVHCLLLVRTGHDILMENLGFTG